MTGRGNTKDRLHRLITYSRRDSQAFRKKPHLYPKLIQYVASHPTRHGKPFVMRWGHNFFMPRFQSTGRVVDCSCVWNFANRSFQLSNCLSVCLSVLAYILPSFFFPSPSSSLINPRTMRSLTIPINASIHRFPMMNKNSKMLFLVRRPSLLAKF